ncbi:TolC family protein [Desulfovibrio sp. OttesenSCG-928-G11]|nr:TolC family protein [Desulfovibrio sp. OttesenSCG-928-G11]
MSKAAPPFKRFSTRRPAVLLLLLVLALALGACQGRKPVERLGPPWNAEKIRHNVRHMTQENSYAAPELPPEDKALSFEECLFTALQFAPDITESVIELELAELKSDDAFWKRFPNFNGRFRVTNNLTKHYQEYSDTVYRIGVSIDGFEPVVSFFESRAAALMEDIAYYTHMLAVEKRARQIGEVLMELRLCEDKHALQAAQVAAAQQSVDYYQARQSDADHLELARAQQKEASARLIMEKNQIAMDKLRLNLKLMLGLDLDRAVKVDAASVDQMLEKDGAANVFADFNWEKAWAATPEARMLGISKKLKDYQVQVAWARYLPSVGFDMYTTNPKSDYAAPSSDDEIFFAMNFTMPLIDWGARGRNVDRAVLQRVQQSQRAKLGMQQFTMDWKEAWQDVKMSQADLKMAEAQLNINKLTEQKIAIEQQSGQVEFSALIEARIAVIAAEISMLDARHRARTLTFDNWVTAGYFRQRFFEPYRNEDRKDE